MQPIYQSTVTFIRRFTFGKNFPDKLIWFAKPENEISKPCNNI